MTQLWKKKVSVYRTKVSKHRQEKMQKSRDCSVMQSKTRRKIEAWWDLWHLTFMFPPMFRGHEHNWCSISSDSVGCTTCGVVHVCGDSVNIIPCNVELQDDSSIVCTYTGIVVKTSSLFDPETSIGEYNAGYCANVHSTRPRLTVHEK